MNFVKKFTIISELFTSLLIRAPRLRRVVPGGSEALDLRAEILREARGINTNLGCSNNELRLGNCHFFCMFPCSFSAKSAMLNSEFCKICFLDEMLSK